MKENPFEGTATDTTVETEPIVVPNQPLSELRSPSYGETHRDLVKLCDVLFENAKLLLECDEVEPFVPLAYASEKQQAADFAGTLLLLKSQIKGHSESDTPSDDSEARKYLAALDQFSTTVHDHASTLRKLVSAAASLEEENIYEAQQHADYVGMESRLADLLTGLDDELEELGIATPGNFSGD